MALNDWKPVIVMLGIAMLGILAGGTLRPAVSAQKTDNSIPNVQRSLALGEDDIEALLLLMDTDKNGKISKREFLGFMEAEFDRLDKDKNGELDPKELTQSQVRVFRPAVGK